MHFCHTSGHKDCSQLTVTCYFAFKMQFLITPKQSPASAAALREETAFHPKCAGNLLQFLATQGPSTRRKEALFPIFGSPHDTAWWSRSNTFLGPATKGLGFDARISQDEGGQDARGRWSQSRYRERVCASTTVLGTGAAVKAGSHSLRLLRDLPVASRKGRALQCFGQRFALV